MMMKIDIHGTNLKPSPALADHVSRRLGFALDRLSHRVRRADVCVTDVSGPHGEPDRVCRVRIDLKPRGSVQVAERHADLYRAVDRASKRLKRLIAREVERRRSRTRVRQQRMA